MRAQPARFVKSKSARVERYLKLLDCCSKTIVQKVAEWAA